MSRKRKPLPLLENVTIEAVAAEGKCVAHVGEMVVFVPFVVPGDVVDLRVRKKRRSYCEATVERFIKKSDVRTEPMCPHFGICGGCKWQTLPYEKQLEAKQQQVYDQLTRIGKIELPEIAPCVGFDQHNRHHIYDVWGHSAHAVAAVPAEVVLRWTMLLHDIGKPACFTRDEQGVGHFYGHPAISADLAADICRRLRMDNRTAERIVTLVRWHDRDIARTEKAIARAVSQLGEETFRQLLAVKRADNAAQSPDDRHRLADIQQAEDLLNTLLAKRQCFSLKDLTVKGGDLMALGLRGREVGDALQYLLNAVLDGTPNDKETLLKLAAERK